MKHSKQKILKLIRKIVSLPSGSTVLLNQTIEGFNSKIPSQQITYQQWLELHIKNRLARLEIHSVPGLFSLLTSIYEKTPPHLFRETANSILEQTLVDFEWVLLAHGFIPPELDTVVQEIVKDPRVKYICLEKNLGIIGGMRQCLEAATGEYVIPVDADDLLTPDALQCLAQAIVNHDSPSFIYSDEDMLIQGKPQIPYYRPDWDPILNLSSSYIWHLCSFRRKEALSLDIYTDLESNWCHDWDTISRFMNAERIPVHLPEILYHWRQHEQSTTNRPEPEKGSLASQRHILELQIAQQKNPELYEIELFPVFRGAPEWWIKRKREQPEPIQVILMANSAEQAVNSIHRLVSDAQYPFSDIHIAGIDTLPQMSCQHLLQELKTICQKFSTGVPHIYCWMGKDIEGLTEAIYQLRTGLTLIFSENVQPIGNEWPWEALCLKAFNPDIVLFSGRIINPDNVVVAGGEIFGFNGVVGCPDYGKMANDAGNFALSLKQRSVSAVHSNFFLGDADFLKDAVNKGKGVATYAFLGAWLGAEAAVQKRRVAFSPLIAAHLKAGISLSWVTSELEQREFEQIYNAFIPDSRWISPFSLPEFMLK